MPATITSSLTPKSVVRHRPIGRSASGAPTTPRASRTTTPTETIPTWKSAQTPIAPSQRQSAVRRSGGSLALLIGGMLLALLLLVVGQMVMGWISGQIETLRYGYPRTYQISAFVGQETGKTASHFLVLNNDGQLEIIEFPGDDATHARIFLGPHLYGASADLVVATIRFVPDGHPRTPDMVLLFQQSQELFRNTGGTFVASP